MEEGENAINNVTKSPPPATVLNNPPTSQPLPFKTGVFYQLNKVS